jgi:uncharacterized protein (DUF1015 family)
MATLIPFNGYRPKPEFIAEIASPPYDVLSSDEAREYAKGKPDCFLHVGKSEIDLPPDIDLHSEAVYAKAMENLNRLVDSGKIIHDDAPAYYIYRQSMGSRTQTGILALASVDEYQRGIIKKHELTRVDKEQDRARHIEVTRSHSGPAFFAYRAVKEIDDFVSARSSEKPEASYTATDGVVHTIWVISEKRDVELLSSLFSVKVPAFYIADGHHRSAAALRVRDTMKAANHNHNGSEGYNFFLAVAFPDNQLAIMDYNRVVKDLNGLNETSFLAKILENFDVRPLNPGEKPEPSSQKTWGMYLGKKWYRLSVKPNTFQANDPIESLDVQILQKNLLAPVLGIQDPRTDKRIDFVGGIRGTAELERRCALDMKIAFRCYPTTIEQLLAIADAGKIMPPKSTWFEPKLADGIVFDRI